MEASLILDLFKWKLECVKTVYFTFLIPCRTNESQKKRYRSLFGTTLELTLANRWVWCHAG